MTRWWWLCGGILLTGGLVWWVVSVAVLEDADRGNASSYGQFVLAAMGLLIVVAELVVRALRARGTTLELDELADNLARAMHYQWTEAASERRLLPAPLPIRWRRCSQPVAGPVAAATRPGPSRFPPLPGIHRVTSRQLHKGTHHALHTIYGGLSSGRLILAGGPGAGKSSAAILLLLDALRYRDQRPTHDRPHIPVPVLFTLHNWDPNTTRVYDWLATKLTEIPSLRGKRGKKHATRLLRAGRIAVFLDGLDEIPPSIRSRALRALSEQAAFRLVLVTRTTELVAAARQHTLAGAAALELRDLTPADAVNYLRAHLVEPAPEPWQRLDNVLTNCPDSPAARALTNPLVITLLRDIYPPSTSEGSPVGPVDELLDTSRFSNPMNITHHLLDNAVTAAYAPKPGHPPPRYTPATARRTLTVIAQCLNSASTRDLAWWTAPTWVPRGPRLLGGALFGGLIFALVGFVALGNASGAAGGFMAGSMVGLLNVLTEAQWDWKREIIPRVLTAIKWRRILSGSAMAARAMAGIVVWSAGYVFFGLSSGEAAFYGGMTILVLLTVTGIFTSWGAGTASPIQLWRGELVFSLAAATAISLCVAIVFGVATDLRAGVRFALMMWIGWMWFISARLHVTLAYVYFSVRYRTPFHLTRFLEDCRSRHLLRTVGPVYQFRHATLQDQLAGK